LTFGENWLEQRGNGVVRRVTDAALTVDSFRLDLWKESTNPFVRLYLWRADRIGLRVLYVHPQAHAAEHPAFHPNTVGVLASHTYRDLEALGQLIAEHTQWPLRLNHGTEPRAPVGDTTVSHGTRCG